MDQPSWNDTLRTTLGACGPCLTCGRSRSNAAANGSDDEYTNSNSVRGVRARADELEGLLASADVHWGGDDDWRDRDDDAAPDADAISLHSHLGPQGRSCAPPRTPKHMSLWGLNVFRRDARGRGQCAACSSSSPCFGPGGRRRSSRREATDDLLARAALDAGPTQLKDVSAADVARRARSGSAASQGHADTPVEMDHERRARRKARKDMRRLAAARAEAPHTPTEFEVFPESGELPPAPHKDIPAPFLHLSAPGPAPDALAHLQAAEDEGAADLNGLAYRAVVGEWEWSAVLTCGRNRLRRHAQAQKSKSKRITKSKSSATSSTLASPPPTSASFPHGVRDSGVYADSPTEFGPFTSGTGGVEDEFDGTPGGFDSSFGVEADAEPEVAREALPSPGLSRGAGGFRFGGGGGKGMGGF
ncbi:hypothetical protein DFH08DRAFT_1035013 [Mycena albidolilacea]|uniref:Uncharacterized protein n=1 Tax=Mycena albidolilacea TaxID=1033008 RepID=A0AAD6ZF27_9AGAR|nr:hypothetical protein DFH08DRAFT_1035013 [Mycena albidolilacea]